MSDRQALPSPRPSGKRLEIEGLRTVAAVLVAIYHIWSGKVSGGVDVFFVITGFLITLTLVGHVRRDGRIRPFAYLGRLARRVWPMAVTVLVAALMITVTLAPEALRARNFAEIVASALYYENWFLAFSAVDYLDQNDPHTPVQHFWAMSLQGQFYVTWLLVGLLVLLAVGGRDLRRFKIAYAAAIALLGIVSFGWSLVQTAENQPFAYFSFATRIWEFAVGALIALAGTRLTIGGRAAGAASWVSVVGLIVCGLVLPVQGSFPGVAALWPVCCAVLLLISTRRDEVRWAGTRLLASTPLSRLGGYAFGIYLWHFPLLVAYRYRYGLAAEPSLLAGIVIIVTAVIAAIVGNHLIERPIANGWRPGWTKPIVAIALAASLVAVVGAGRLGLHRSEQAVAQLGATTAAAQGELAGCFGYAAKLAKGGCEGRLAASDLSPERSAVFEDAEGAYRCWTDDKDPHLPECTYGPGPFRMALVGTSHAAMLSPLLEEVAPANGWHLDGIIGSKRCLWSVQRAGDPDIEEPCATRIAEMEDILFGPDPLDVVIFAGGRGTLIQTEKDLAAAAENWRALQERGTKVIVIQDNPRPGKEAALCVAEVPEEDLRSGACDTPRRTSLSEPDRFVAIADRIGAPVVKTKDFYCGEKTCPAVIGNVIVYRDEHHVTLTYERTFASELLARLERQVSS